MWARHFCQLPIAPMSENKSLLAGREPKTGLPDPEKVTDEISSRAPLGEFFFADSPKGQKNRQNVGYFRLLDT
jgi:hypothetical protein